MPFYSQLLLECLFSNDILVYNIYELSNFLNTSVFTDASKITKKSNQKNGNFSRLRRTFSQLHEINKTAY